MISIPFIFRFKLTVIALAMALPPLVVAFAAVTTAAAAAFGLF